MLFERDLPFKIWIQQYFLYRIMYFDVYILIWNLEKEKMLDSKET